MISRIQWKKITEIFCKIASINLFIREIKIYTYTHTITIMEKEAVDFKESIE